MNKLLYFLLVIFFFSCKRNENKIEKKFIETFPICKHNLENIIKHVETKYFANDSFKNLSRLQFIIYPKEYQKGTVFSDPKVSKELNGTLVFDLSFEKSSKCLKEHPFDLVRFRLDPYASDSQYYYVYEYCPYDSMNVDKPHFKSTTLESHWFLEIEK